MRELSVCQHNVLTATVGTSFSDGLFFLKQFAPTPAQPIETGKRLDVEPF